MSKSGLSECSKRLRFRSAHTYACARQADWEGSDATTDAGDGEIRKMGGFEAFFSKAVAHGLGLIYYVVEVEGPVESKLLEQALRLSVKRHPNLRTRIVNR